MTFETTIHECSTINRDGATFLKACLHIRRDGALVHQEEVEVNQTAHPTEAEVRAELARVRDSIIARITAADAIAASLSGVVLE